MWKGVLTIAVAAFMLGNAQSNAADGDAKRQQTNRGAPTTRSDLPSSPTASQGAPCPGQNPGKLDCNTLSAVANVRQADAAERFNNLARFEIGVGIATAVAALFAAFFAASAAKFAAKSYRAFVAAEDASLSVEFSNGTVIESAVEGVRQPDTFFLTAVITNIGKGPARVHGCYVRQNQGYIPVSKTLKTDESEELGWRVDIGPLTEFSFCVLYTTPIRPQARLVMVCMPIRTKDNRRIIANVTKSRIEEGLARQKWWQLWRSKE
jgi:hypothetical protein